MKYIIILLSTLFVITSCTGTKKFTKMGQKQEAAGLVREAAGSYYTALQRKRENVDAQIGMKKTGQLVLNELLGDFAKKKSFGTAKEAVYSFHAARDYRDKIKRVGVELQLAEFYVMDYNSAREIFLKELYDEGTDLLEDEKYAEAEARFKEIKTLDPNYKDANELGDIAFIEPVYDDAMEAFSAGQYRKAYENFDKVLGRRSDYKEAAAKKEEALKLGIFTIALLPYENATGQPGMDAKMNAYTLEALTNIHDPFLRVVDREHMQAILQEQKLQLSGVVNEQTAVEVGNLVGAQAILTGTVLSFDQNNGRLKTVEKEAYEAYKIEKTNPETGAKFFETRYRPVKYTEYYNSNSCSVAFQYKLISLKTGEILRTEIIEKSVSDEVLYAKYGGEGRSLVPAGQGGPNLNDRDRNALLQMLSARQTLTPSGELSNELFDQVCKKMSTEIGSVVYSIVK